MGSIVIAALAENAGTIRKLVKETPLTGDRIASELHSAGAKTGEKIKNLAEKWLGSVAKN